LSIHVVIVLDLLDWFSRLLLLRANLLRKPKTNLSFTITAIASAPVVCPKHNL
jgi:hypothetical protein